MGKIKTLTRLLLQFTLGLLYSSSELVLLDNGACLREDDLFQMPVSERPGGERGEPTFKMILKV